MGARKLGKMYRLRISNSQSVHFSKFPPVKHGRSGLDSASETKTSHLYSNPVGVSYRCESARWDGKVLGSRLQGLCPDTNNICKMPTPLS